MGVGLSRLLLLGCLTLGGCCFTPAGEWTDAGVDAGVDAGPVDGGAGLDGVWGTCTNQLECGCTCVCPSGARGVTYSSCIFGFCESCTNYCLDFCL
jgi:hypothetical protein